MIDLTRAARADRAFWKGGRDMIAWDGRRLWLAVRMVIRTVRMARHEQVSMWECMLLTSGAAPLSAAGPLRWVRSLGGDRLAGSSPAGPGPERNGPVTRAGGRGPGSRPGHRERILQEHPGSPDRHQLRREPGVMRSPWRRPANVWSSPSGKNTRAHHRQPAHHLPRPDTAS
jgi:hypothetical protein